MAGKSFAVFLQTDFDKPCRVRALSFYLRIPIGQTDLFQGTEQVKAIVEGSLDQRRIPNNLDTEDSNAALHPFFELKATHILSANLFSHPTVLKQGDKTHIHLKIKWYSKQKI